jgi:hypothetical protein
MSKRIRAVGKRCLICGKKTNGEHRCSEASLRAKDTRHRAASLEPDGREENRTYGGRLEDGFEMLDWNG